MNMQKYQVLVVDDDEPLHYMVDGILGSEFLLTHAYNAQEAIDKLAEQPFHLILADIHMPGISGLELLESLRDDRERSRIPILIITNLPTVEKEQKAYNLGAADFLDKAALTSSPDEVRNRVRMKLVTDIRISDLDADMDQSKNRVVTNLMSKAIRGSFEETAGTLCSELNERFSIDYTAFWRLDHEQPELVCTDGLDHPAGYDGATLQQDQGYQNFLQTRKAYVTNHIYSEDQGVMVDFSREQELAAEIGVPLFAVNERGLLVNNMQIPEDAELFGLVTLKRSKLFTSREFEVLSRLVLQSGSIIWRLKDKQQRH